MIESALSRILLHNWDYEPNDLIEWANDLRGKPSPDHVDVLLDSIESFQLVKDSEEGYHMIVLYSVVQKDTLSAAYIEKLFTAL